VPDRNLDSNDLSTALPIEWDAMPDTKTTGNRIRKYPDNSSSPPCKRKAMQVSKREALKMSLACFIYSGLL
jgi:hypothetical protein